MGRINQISKDIIDLEKRVKNLFEDQKKLKELTSKRIEIIQKRIDNKKEILRQHLAFASKINNDLKNSIDDFFITVKYIENVYSPEFEDTLKNLMSWRTVQVSKAAVIARSISVYDFVKAIKTKNDAILKNITFNEQRLLSVSIQPLFWRFEQ